MSFIGQVHTGRSGRWGGEMGGGLYFWEPLLFAVELFVQLMTGVKEEPCQPGILMTGWLSVPSGA